MITILIVVAILSIAIILVFLYNNLVKLKVLVENAWSDIGVQLKRRHDLIPNLIRTVEGYTSHERETLQALVETRNQALKVSSPGEVSRAENQLTAALKSIFALAEAYPQLRASENFSQLQNELSDIERAVQGARRYYNASVRDLNTRVAQFPGNLVAGMFGFTAGEFLELDPGEAEVPKVEFK